MGPDDPQDPFGSSFKPNRRFSTHFVPNLMFLAPTGTLVNQDWTWAEAWADLGLRPTLDDLGLRLGPILDQPWTDFGPTLGGLWADPLFEISTSVLSHQQTSHLSCLSSRHLSCLNSRHLSCLNRKHLSCLNRRHHSSRPEAGSCSIFC